jgi:iron complex outermembrane receptor protein
MVTFPTVRTALLYAVAYSGIASTAFAQAQSAATLSDEGKGNATQPVQVAAAVESAASPFGIAAVEQVTVTARRREENAQEVPVSLSVVGVQQLEATGTYNIGQLTQLTPSVQFFSSNPRNTAITIRGLGTSFGLTNDGLESGVGLYIDQVYQSRPAAATFDFIDVERVEVLRGPQGTLFGKNTTAGAISIAIQIPTFERQVQAEVSAGNYGFFQGKASISGPIAGNVLAARLSVEGTLRDGTIHNVTSGKDVNNQNDFSTRAQLLYRPNDKFSLRLTGDYNTQKTICCALGFVRVGATLKSAALQDPALAAAAGYAPPSLDPFDRLIDANSPAQANQVFGGVSAIADWDIGPVTLTSVSAWRTWNWDPNSDRDFTKLSIQTISANPDNQNQYSQEFRVASNGKQTVDYVAGLYYFRQKIDATPVAQYGADAARWLLAVVPPATPRPANLLDGYRLDAVAHSDTKSYAGFAQATWNITDALHFTPGLRYTYEDKTGSYSQSVSGGLPTIAGSSNDNAKLSIARPQSYSAKISKGSLSGQANLAYDVTPDTMVYATYSRGYKSGGINLAGIPLNAANVPVISTAIIKPEAVTTYEVGVKNSLFDNRLTLNVALFDTEVKDYQVNVVDTGPGALRGYLSNIPKVRSRGVEFDSAFVLGENFSGYASGAWTEGEYVKFANGPCPLELIKDSTGFCDLSGRPLPGLSRWSISGGGEYRLPIGDEMAYVGVDASYRSGFYSDASDSKYLKINSYSLINLRAGYVFDSGWEAFVWVKNLFDQNYFQYLQPQTGNSGEVVGLLGDPRTVGVTLRVKY